MQPRKYLLATCSVLLMAALLAACAAPAAAPAPPVDTPAPPAAESDPVAVVRAWVDALNSGDTDAALDFFTEDSRYRMHYTANNKDELRWVFTWLTSLETEFNILNCQPQDNQADCSLTVTDGCIAISASPTLPIKSTFTVQDGKIKEAVGSGTGPDWNAYWSFVPIVQSWERVFRAEEFARFQRAEGTREGGELAIKMCREYDTIVKTQELATAAAAQSLVNAINSGDTDAALALFTQSDEIKFRVMSDEVVGADQMGAMFDYLAGKEAQFQITDCEWQGISTQCAVSLVDGCIAASGVPDGLHGKMTFYSEEDGTLRQVVVVPAAAERKTYEAWLETESAWASANRADEFAQAEGYSQAAGAMAVKLCQEYAIAPKLDDATTAKIEGLLNDQMQPNGVPGYAMCVVMDGNQVYSKGFGVAELGADRPVTPQSVFAIASTTKSFTGVALMQLVEQGKVDLDAPVTAYLPYFEMADPRYQDITVRMLASHMSGLTDEAVTATLPESVEPTAVDEALEGYVRSLSDDTLTATPGETWQYATVNFSILGDLIGKVSGVPYHQYVVQNILEPLKMTHSTFDAAAISPDSLVGEYTTGEDAVVNAMPVSPTSRIELPAGGLYSTCEDMTRWMQVNLNRGELDGLRILKPETYDILWKVEAPTGLDEFFGAWAGQYGLGWGVAEDGGHFLAGHPGGGAGQTTGFQLAPDDNLGVTVLANWGTDSNYPAWMAAADVIYALLGIGQ